MCMEFLYCLKRERDISINPMLSGGKTIFKLSPPLKEVCKGIDTHGNIFDLMINHYYYYYFFFFA